jgi:hypothetical protein
MKESQNYLNLEEYHDAMRTQQHDMETVIDSNEHTQIRDSLLRLTSSLKENYPFTDMVVITGEQPYGALGGTKVLAKRVLAQTLAETYDDVTGIEMFANHDLVGSEPGFFRLVLPTVGAKNGLATLNIVTGKLKENGLTASGILLPNSVIDAQVNKACESLPHHYPTTKLKRQHIGYDPKIGEEWARTYDNENDLKSNYADAHIQWLTDFENKIGLEMEHITTEGQLDLLLARNGGIDLLNTIWKRGLFNLRNINYESVALKLDDNAIEATPFNLAKNGVRLLSRYANSDHSLVNTINPITKEEDIITMDEALSGSYDFSFRAVPRTITYSLAGIEGSVTGGGSIYNTDARSFMDTFRLPYFPIIHMSAQEDGTKISNLQYDSLAFARKSHDEARTAVKTGNVSMLDLAISCHFEDIKESIEKVKEIGGELSPGQIITIPNKIDRL